MARPKEKGYVYFMVSDADVKGFRYRGGTHVPVKTEETRILLEMTGKARLRGRIEDKKFKLTKPIPIGKKDVKKGISLSSLGGRFN